MSDRAPVIARIPLARSVPRLLTVPAVVGLAGGVAIAAGLLIAGDVAGYALAALGGLLLVGALVGAAVLLSVHVDIEESAVVVGRIGRTRRYALTPGPVTRVRVRGPNAARLRPRFGALGWGIGRARLRDEEEVELVRLAATQTAILIPTESGRLAVAPAHDEELLDALSRAARARQRLETGATSAMPAAPVAEVAAAPAPIEPETAVEPERPPVPMTGIERALLEERLAREHADEERAAEEVAAAMAAAVAAAEAAEAPAEPATDLVLHPAVEADEARPQVGRARRWVAATSFVLLPTAGASIALALGVTMGEIPQPGSDVARITALGLVLAGPATSVGAVMALAWWPRIVGIVVAGGLAATVFIGRSLIGS